jgi:hypothetical protein
MDYANPTEIWWPHPDALDDLTVEITEEEDGSATIHLEAPDGTECADWLNYFNASEERHQVFEREFLRTLIEHIRRVTDGQSEVFPDKQDPDRSRDQEDGTGSVEEHQPGSDGK